MPHKSQTDNVGKIWGEANSKTCGHCKASPREFKDKIA
jgi:hypothetical protein